MTFANAESLERVLHSAVFRVRDVPVLLMDTGAGAVILSLTGVPDTVTDKDVLKCLKKYGTIIGKEKTKKKIADDFEKKSKKMCSRSPGAKVIIVIGGGNVMDRIFFYE